MWLHPEINQNLRWGFSKFCMKHRAHFWIQFYNHSMLISIYWLNLPKAQQIRTHLHFFLAQQQFSWWFWRLPFMQNTNLARWSSFDNNKTLLQKDKTILVTLFCFKYYRCVIISSLCPCHLCLLKVGFFLKLPVVLQKKGSPGYEGIIIFRNSTLKAKICCVP